MSCVSLCGHPVSLDNTRSRHEVSSLRIRERGLLCRTAVDNHEGNRETKNKSSLQAKQLQYSCLSFSQKRLSLFCLSVFSYYTLQFHRKASECSVSVPGSCLTVVFKCCGVNSVLHFHKTGQTTHRFKKKQKQKRTVDIEAAEAEILTLGRFYGSNSKNNGSYISHNAI